MTTKIHQMLDSTIDVTSSPAFSSVCMSFPDVNGHQVEVYLDMESFVRVMSQMDEGASAVVEIASQAPRKERNWLLNLLARWL